MTEPNAVTRPLLVTRDLRSFWEKTYPELRKQLSRLSEAPLAVIISAPERTSDRSSGCR